MLAPVHSRESPVSEDAHHEFAPFRCIYCAGFRYNFPGLLHSVRQCVRIGGVQERAGDPAYIHTWVFQEETWIATKQC